MVSLLANGQTEQGDSVTVIYSNRQETPQDLSTYFNGMVKLVNIQMQITLERFTAIQKLRSHIRNKNADIVFLHSSYAGFLGRIALLGLGSRPRIFYIPHCISLLRDDIGLFRKSTFLALEWFAALKRSEYIACSDSEADLIRRLIPIRECHVVENAIKLSRIPTTPPARKRTVVCVGHIRPQKDPLMFAEIARIVRQRDKDISFIWIGDGGPKEKRILQSAGVKLRGWMPPEAVGNELLEATVYLSTSRWEGMPVSLIEALNFGLIAVARSCPGNIDVIRHAETGYLFTSIDEAIACIMDIFQNPNSKLDMTTCAGVEAKDRFSVSRYLEEMRNLCSSPRK
ncbi:glycosyltransferase [Pusillimonas sp.]|uniref:glycosyltransferase n=1 Tax=Pusillimonas sp. TaxID=3040095 RepID=UPI0029B1FE4F|nr:glycosyltransferase [Pusillimonas sp.]MDX3895321.1 glycosyltransferase [Pusillimonas sp.]